MHGPRENLFTTCWHCSATRTGRTHEDVRDPRACEARALARLQKALPEIFPAPVLTYALNRRWTPPMPRLAVDGYWRAHPLRADRLARALAARSGTPKGWTWRHARRSARTTCR